MMPPSVKEKETTVIHNEETKKVLFLKFISAHIFDECLRVAQYHFQVCNSIIERYRETMMNMLLFCVFNSIYLGSEIF